jgi:ribosomal protein S18 acetylase RimI-like enzyme
MLAALGYVTSVYVVPGWRNRGIGSRMLDAILARAREEDLDLLMLWPSTRAVSMYRRAGFRTSPDGLEHPLGHA